MNLKIFIFRNFYIFYSTLIFLILLFLYNCQPSFNIYDVATNSNIIFNISNDNISPEISNIKLTITYENNGVISNIDFYSNVVLFVSNFKISGIINDNSNGSGIKGVYFKLTGGFILISSNSNWETNLNLSEGKYNLSLYAVDKNNNISLTNTNIFITIMQKIYVSTNGSDNNTGSKVEPLLNIQSAITKALNYGFREIYIMEGNYYPGNGLQVNDDGIYIGVNDIKIIGGWNSNFTSNTGYSYLMITNNNNFRIIVIENATNIYLSGLYISNGYSDNGGGIYINNVSYSIITNCIVDNCRAILYGGGVFLDNSKNNNINVYIKNCLSLESGGGIYLGQNTRYNNINSIISNNNAIYGGGIYNNGYFNMIYGIIVSNNADYGGGIYNYNSHNNRIDSIISGNIAGIDGGGLYINSSKFNLIQGEIISNISLNNGGGIYLTNSSENNLSGRIYFNTSSNGAGIYLSYGRLNKIESVIFNNTANNNGGGIYLDFQTNTTLNSIISNNFANNGGGIYDNFGISNIITNLIFTNNSLLGAGIYINKSRYNYLYCNILNNRAISYGAGIYINTSSNLIINSLIQNNISASAAGVFLIDSFSNIFLSNSIISRNEAETGNGGGIYIYNDSKFNIIYCKIEFNKALAGNGGGIFIDYGSIMSSNNYIYGMIVNNNANYGGGVYLNNSFNSIIDANINSNISIYGGGIYIYGGLSNIIQGNIVYNESTFSGAGLYIRAIDYSTIPGDALFIRNANITLNVSKNSPKSIIHIYNIANGFSSGNGILYFINNRIGGVDSSSVGIYEENADVKGHTLVSNTFYKTSLKLSDCYQEFTGNTKYNTDSDLNTAGDDLTTDAATAFDNILQ